MSSLPMPSCPSFVVSSGPAAAEKAQRGVPDFKGENSNSQPTANKEFTHRYFDAGQVDFAHAMDFEYSRPGVYVKGGLNGHDGFFFKTHGVAGYFNVRLDQQAHVM
eukprot:1345669-Alexandrium_andersonii.AAC.1